MTTEKTGANAVQHGGLHYKRLAIEPWDYVAANDLGYFEGNAIKYLTRWKDKGGLKDLRKAIHFVEKLIEVQTNGVPQISAAPALPKIDGAT